MADVKKAKEIHVQTEDKAGMIGEVTGAIAGAGVNISAITGYGEKGKAHFMIITDDNAKAKEALSKKGWKAEEKDVVVVACQDKVGIAAGIGKKLKDKNISLSYCYGTTCSCCGGKCGPECIPTLVLAGSDTDKIVEALK